jgi:hypothetical protein
MSTLPASSMVDVATRIIDLLGNDMDFYRHQGGIWQESVLAVRVHVQSRSSSYRRSFRGLEITADFKGFVSAVADIRKGDRTTINDTYYIVDALEDRGTHLELGLKQTDEGPNA